MTVRYVGPGGNDANDGLSWATRKLTLNGVEDSPVAPGDIVYVGPGVYRETLTVDVSGNLSEPIMYIGDVTGEHTDGVGGIVRITGSDDDITVVRNEAVYMLTKYNRAFKGFFIDLVDQYGFQCSTSCANLTFEDIYFGEMGPSTTAGCIRGSGESQNFTIRRCIGLTLGPNFSLVFFTNSTTVSNSNILIEDCIGYGGQMQIRIERVGGITVRNCTIIGSRGAGVRVNTALAAGQTVTVQNCIIYGCVTGVQATTLGELVEDYNSFFNCNTDRSTVSVGANSVNYPAVFAPVLLSGGYVLQAPAIPFTLSKWSKVGARAGGTFPALDLFGLSRPSTASKNSWGAVQYQPISRETGTRRGTSGASLKMADAGRTQFHVPVTNQSTTFSVYVYREANYAGTSPQMIIKQPGQADVTVTDVGAAGGWNQLTTTLTPAATPGYVIVELVSNNTATSGSYAVYFDDLDVS